MGQEMLLLGTSGRDREETMNFLARAILLVLWLTVVILYLRWRLPSKERK